MPDFIAFVAEQMATVARVRARAMFGGYGIYEGERMFAIVIGDTLYLKADAATRPDFEVQGLQPFTYEARGRKKISLSYYEAPPEVFEQRDVMRAWMSKALDAALRAAKPAANAAARTARTQAKSPARTAGKSPAKTAAKSPAKTAAKATAKSASPGKMRATKSTATRVERTAPPKRKSARGALAASRSGSHRRKPSPRRG